MTSAERDKRKEEFIEMLMEGRWTMTGAAVAAGMSRRWAEEVFEELKADGLLRQVGMTKGPGRPASIWEWAE